MDNQVLTAIFSILSAIPLLYCCVRVPWFFISGYRFASFGTMVFFLVGTMLMLVLVRLVAGNVGLYLGTVFEYFVFGKMLWSFWKLPIADRNRAIDEQKALEAGA